MARHALLIATTQHSDAVFSRSTAPEADVKSLAMALRSPGVGGFDSVAELVNRPSDVVREEIEGFFQGRTEDDLLVLYFSGHGVVNARGLHLVTASTKRDRLAATAVQADFVRDLMDGCRSRQQVLILDCCYSGALDSGASGGVGASAGTGTAFEGNGLGRVVLAATDAIQFAFEADDPTVNPSSRFTHFLAEGLQGGAADLDRDGQIKLDELYEYACQQLVRALSKQNPGKWNYWQRSDLVIAKNPRPVARPDLLSPKLLAALESTEPWEVEGAVRELVRLSGDPNPGLALAAKERLARLVKTVSERPREALGTAVVSTPAATSSTAGAPTATLDFSSGSSRTAGSPTVPEARPAGVAGAAVPIPPPNLAPAADSPAGSPAKPGAKSYASLRPRSVRPASPEPGPAQAAASAVPIPPLATASPASPAAHEVATPDASLEPSQVGPLSPEPAPAQAAASAAPIPPLATASPAGSPAAHEVATPDASPEPAPAQAATSAVPTPPVGLFSTGGGDEDLVKMLRQETGQWTQPEQTSASEPSPLLAQPPAKVPPSSLAGTLAGLPAISWIRSRPRLLLAGAAGLLVIVLGTYLLLRKGSLNIEVRPNGNWSLGEIAVIVDGEKRCSRSPCRVDGLTAGGHEVVATATGYRRQSLPVAVSRGAVNPAAITLELDGPTGIAVADLGSDVQLFVDGQSRGNVPQEIGRLAPGEHEIRIEGGERYHSFKTRVLVEAGKMVSLAPKLKVKKGRVTIQLGQGADEAKIELVCGDQRRPAPKQVFDIAPEPPCKVVAAKDGFEPFEQPIQFTDGEAERLIKVDLVPGAQPQQAQAGVRADDRAARLPDRQSGVERPRLNP
jgi:hypothetical protein